MNDVDFFSGQPPHEPRRTPRRAAGVPYPELAPEDDSPWDPTPRRDPAAHSPADGEGADRSQRRGRRRRNEPEELQEWEREAVDPAEFANMRPRGRRHRPAPDTATPPPISHGPKRDHPEPGHHGEPGGGTDPFEQPSPVPRRRGPRPEEEPGPAGDQVPAPRWDSDPEPEDDQGSLDELGLPYDEEDTEDTAEPQDESGSRRRHLAESRRAEAELRSSRSRGKRKRKRKRKHSRALAPTMALLILFVVVAGGGGAGYFALRSYFAPPDYEGEGSGEVEVVISDGDTGEDIGQTLESAGVVASVRAFTNALRGEDTSDFQPGTYRLRNEMSGEAAVALLLDPSSRIGAQVTIREGLRLPQIFAEIESTTGIPVAELEAAAEDTESLELPEYADGVLVGYLFPDTYDFNPDDEAPEVLRAMVERFKQLAEELNLEERAEEAGFDPHEAMAIAAIVQAESGGVPDMPKIARVVYNRLEVGMELGMDSTCFYVIDEYGIALTNDQLNQCESAESEYATYGRQGLPAGPIVSPGQDAIEAALDPEPGDWLFFVATDPENGVTEFAETEAEFQVLRERFEQNRGDL